MNLMIGNAMGAAGWVALAVGLALWLRSGKKSAAERERERRLAVNLVGRITDGTLLETARPPGDLKSPLLISYRYAAAGVEYSAAQDVSALEHLIRLENCWPGKTASVKYDPHNPFNSIIVCELWSGLPEDSGEPKPARRASDSPAERGSTLRAEE